jgi:hypothetical protein
VKTYVVACYYFMESELDQRVIKAKNEFDAAVDYLGARPPGILDLDDLYGWIWDQDLCMNVIEI